MADPTPSQPYTIHEDAVTMDAATAPARRRALDPVSLVAGLSAVVLALLAMLGLLDAVDPRWVLAAGAVAVGLAVLLTTLRKRSG